MPRLLAFFGSCARKAFLRVTTKKAGKPDRIGVRVQVCENEALSPPVSTSQYGCSGVLCVLKAALSPSALDLGVSLMETGEKAFLKTQSRFAYGELGRLDRYQVLLSKNEASSQPGSETLGLLVRQTVCEVLTLAPPVCPGIQTCLPMQPSRMKWSFWR